MVQRQHDISQDAETVHHDTKMDKPKSKYTSIHEKPKEANTLVYICYNKTQLRKANTHQALLASG